MELRALEKKFRALKNYDKADYYKKGGDELEIAEREEVELITKAKLEK